MYDDAGTFQVPCSLNGLAAGASGGALGWVFGFGELRRDSGGGGGRPPLSPILDDPPRTTQTDGNAQAHSWAGACATPQEDKG